MKHPIKSISAGAGLILKKKKSLSALTLSSIICFKKNQKTKKKNPKNHNQNTPAPPKKPKQEQSKKHGTFDIYKEQM